MKKHILWAAILLLPNCTCNPTEHTDHSGESHGSHTKEATGVYKDHTGQETELRFGEAYTYDPTTEYARPDYKQPKTITYNADGTGTFVDEEKATGKFKWHFTPKTNGGEMNITAWYDTKDSEGNPAPQKDAEDVGIVQHIMQGGTGIHENGSDRIYNTKDP